MPFKEIAAYSVGGIGAYFVIVIIWALQLSVGNFIIGNAIGIEPTKIYMLYLISVASSFPLTAVRANIIDNTRSRKGKYRPWLLMMGVPTVLLAIGFVWMPYEQMSMNMRMLTVLLFNIGFQFFFSFFYDSYENLIYVLSPNTQERTDVSAVKAVIYSIAPSITGIVMPLAAKFLTNGDMTDMKLYRFAYPPMLIIGILLVIYDMTQLRRLENFRRDFVANVSHEIKTPLTVIRGAVETLRDGAIDEPESAARFMQIIELHSERLTSLVEDILSLSRLECHAVGDGSHFTTVGAALPVSTAMELAQARADSAGIKLVCTVESDPKIKADVQLLEQAVLNLIDNAIKHSGESREIRIRVGEEEGEAFIEVSDHGCGIPAEHLPRLFERFYRVDKARSRKAGGTGLGLAIVKHIMQLHRGRAEVKSRVGEGSTFTLRLPVAHS